MITKNYIKTIVAGLLARIRLHEITEEELLSFLDELGIVQPLTNTNGAVYTNNSGKIYIL